MLKKVSQYFIISCFVLGLCLSFNIGEANVAGTPAVYKVYLKKLAVGKVGAGQIISLFKDKYIELDIASNSFNADLNNYIKSVSIPSGNYDFMHVEYYTTYIVKGIVYKAGRTYYTAAGGTKHVAGNITDVSKLPGYDEMQVEIGQFENSFETDRFPIPIVGKGQPLKLSVNVNLQGTLVLDGSEIIPDEDISSSVFQL